MQTHSLKDWFFATRPWSFPASLATVVASLALLYNHGHDVDWFYGVWAIVNIVIFHAAGNTWSDYFDFKHGVDAEDTFGVKTITSGQFRPEEIRSLATTLLAVALIGGVVLALLTTWTILFVGLCGALLAVFYPYLKFHALGDLDIFLNFALLPAIGTSLIAIGEIDWDTMFVAVPLGSVTVAILHANNTRDIATDRRANITTLAMRIGVQRAIDLYCLEIALPFVWILFMCAIEILPWLSMLTFIALLPMQANIKEIVNYRAGNGDIALLDTKTAKLQLILTMLLSATLIADELWLQ